MPRVTSRELGRAIRRLRSTVENIDLTEQRTQQLNVNYTEARGAVTTAETIDWTEGPPVIERIEVTPTAAGEGLPQPGEGTVYLHPEPFIDISEYGANGNWLPHPSPSLQERLRPLPLEEEQILPALVCHYCRADIVFVPDDLTKMYQCECKSTNLFGVRTLYKNLSRNLI